MNKQEALLSLDECRWRLEQYTNVPRKWHEALNMAIEALQDDWIPVSERLPNTNGIFIVTRRISDGFECRNITDACYFDGSSTWHDDTRVNHERKNIADVLAWRPLPEPYKESEE